MTQDSGTAYETLAEMAGLNVIFDPDFRGARIRIDLNNVDILRGARHPFAADTLILETCQQEHDSCLTGQPDETPRLR